MDIDKLTVPAAVVLALAMLALAISLPIAVLFGSEAEVLAIAHMLERLFAAVPQR